MDSPLVEPLILELDSPAATLERAGGKGASLARMAAAGLPVPSGFHITTSAYRRFVTENELGEAILAAAATAAADDPGTLEQASARIRSRIVHGRIPEDLAAAIRRSYRELGGEDAPVAVRSSATAEDLPELSFAGQHDTELNVCGGEHVLEAVRRCWASLWTARALGYRARQGIRPEEVTLAVVVQQFVPADVAGILFTANPLTGDRDSMMINAAWGLGEAIVGGHVTPDTFVVNKQTGAVTSQVLADKDVMTVRPAQGQGTREVPVPAERRKKAALEPEQAAELVRLGTEIEQLYGRPMDVEWCLHDGRFSIVQARPITALPEPRATFDWPLPRPKGKYARSSAIELLPDPLSPLFATLALPMWADGSRKLMRVVGFAVPESEPLFVTINDYAYYDFSWFGTWSMLRSLPRMLLQGFDWIKRAQARWADGARPRYAKVVETWAARDLAVTPAAQLLDGASAIVKAATDHYLTIQSGILPAAYTSEMIFTAFYHRLVRRKDDPPALTFLLGFDSAPILAEKSLYDLASWARSQPELARHLSDTPGTDLAAAYRSSASPVTDEASWGEFRRRFADHLDRFGHAIYDLDFAKGLAADEPAPLLEALKYFLTDEARSPYERQSAAATARDQAERSLSARRRGLRRQWCTRLLGWAQRYAPLREDALTDVGLGWPLLRRMFGELGQRLVGAGAIARRDDVFWLMRDEVEAAAQALDEGRSLVDHRRDVSDRRATWERERAVTPPVVLPVKGGARFLGIDFTRWMPARTDQALGDRIRGVGASPGRVVGLARVLHGPAEFDQMHRGDILVAKITTPAWTPLFALASGVVTDVGGPLSHSSIVAREYQIPAVLGTGVATERIRSGQRIAVDGDAGIVTVTGTAGDPRPAIPGPRGPVVAATTGSSP